jgi:mono/diheme cytochrome c family protein
MKRFLGIAILVLAVGAMSTAQNGTARTTKKPKAAAAASGDSAALYKSKCQVCHGADGKGDTAAGKKLGVKDFHDPEVAKMSDAELIKITRQGKNKMPKYEGKLSDDQIKALVKYARSLK